MGTNEHFTNSVPSPASVRSVQEAGVAVEWLYEGRIIVFHLADVRRQTADAWAILVLNEVAQIPPNQPVLFLHDARAIEITPYLSPKVPELHQRAVT